MKEKLLSFLLLLISTLSFGQSVLIQPGQTNGIFSKNVVDISTDNDPSNTFAPPLSGPGTRLMWIPGKSAFRVGTANGTQWNALNIGTWSFASGQNTIASGAYSTAMGGTGTIASGTGSIALGEIAIASGSNSFATGIATNALGNFSTAMGFGTTASGGFSTSMGNSTTALGDNATAVGDGITAKAFGSLAIGRFNDPINSSSTSAAVLTDPLFIIGNGTASNALSNAMMVLKNGNVGIGDNAPTTKLSVSKSGSGNAFSSTTTGTGQAGNFTINNATNSSAALVAITNGTGNAGNFTINNSISSSNALYSTTLGTGRAGLFQISNVANASPALTATTDGTGVAIVGTNNGTGQAGNFQIPNSSNASNALSATTNGSGNSIYANNTGTGVAGYFQINNALSPSNALFGYTNGGGTAVYGFNVGLGKAGFFQISNVANAFPAIIASTNGTGNGIDASSASGIGGYFSSTSGYALVTGTGKVGIGTNTPIDKLTVQTTSGSNGITHTDGTTSLTTIVTPAAGYIGTKSNHPLYFMANSLAPMILTTGGNLGIGTTTPSATLDVNGNVISEGGSAGFRFNDRANNAKGYQWFTSSGNAYLFRQHSSPTEVISVLENGNMGVGTNTPTEKLTVKTSGYGFSQTDGTVTLSSYIGGGTIGGWFGTKSNHPLYFYTGGTSPIMTIGTNGNVGIGTYPNSPTELLDVSGKLKTKQIKITDGNEGDGKVLVSDATGNGTWTGLEYFRVPMYSANKVISNGQYTAIMQSGEQNLNFYPDLVEKSGVNTIVTNGFLDTGEGYYQINVKGVYHFNIQVPIFVGSGGYVTATIYKTGTVPNSSASIASAKDGIPGSVQQTVFKILNASSTIYCNVGDKIFVNVRWSSGAMIWENISHDNDKMSIFSGYLVR